MSQYSVGKDVVSYCGKCKLTLGHIIVTMKNANTPGKVECNTCKATHNFRSAPVKKTGATRTRRASKKTIPVPELWKQEMAKAKADSVPYSIRGSFLKGDIIEHKKFGPGIVQDIVDNDKIEVIFNSEIRMLVHNK